MPESVRLEKGNFEYEFNVCMGPACPSHTSDKLKDALTAAVATSGKQVLVRRTGCMGLCAAGPLLLVDPQEILYQHVKAANATDVVASLGGEPFAELQCDLRDHFDQQVHVVLENSGHIDPERIDDYIARDGYLALVKVLTEMEPNDVIKEITESGLRGRGGGGYPTGLKWGTVAKASGDHKYVICNGDEGDPGAFMDRSVLESHPQPVLEGMAIAAYAVGASKGYIYVRAEYPLAVARLKTAIRFAERQELLGNGIFGSHLNFPVSLPLAPGALVCG